MDNTGLVRRRRLMFTASNCQFLQPRGTYSSCGFCCLPLKTQQYLAIVGQRMWKQSQRNLRTNSEHYGFASFVCSFSMHVLLLPCQDFLSAGSGLMCNQPKCVYCLVSYVCLSFCVCVTDLSKLRCPPVGFDAYFKFHN